MCREQALRDTDNTGSDGRRDVGRLRVGRVVGGSSERREARTQRRCNVGREAGADEARWYRGRCAECGGRHGAGGRRRLRRQQRGRGEARRDRRRHSASHKTPAPADRNTPSLCRSASGVSRQRGTARIRCRGLVLLRRRCCTGLRRAAVDRYLLPAGRSAANPPHAAAAIDRWDRHTTDGHRTHTPCSAYCAGSANNSFFPETGMIGRQIKSTAVHWTPSESHLLRTAADRHADVLVWSDPRSLVSQLSRQDQSVSQLFYTVS